MEKATTILSFEVENVKRVKVVEVKCDGQPIVVMGGDNQQGKTSVLDAIKWALLGKTYAPSSIKHEGAVDDPAVTVTLSNGVKVERYGENGNLKITAPDGVVSRKEGDLKAIINLLSLDLGKFIRSSDRDKAECLLSIIGCRETLAAMDKREAELEADRLLTGRDKRGKEAHAAELPWHEGTPIETVSLTELLAEQKEIIKLNGENQYWRERHTMASKELAEKQEKLRLLQAEVEDLQQKHKSGAEYIATLKDRDPAAIEQQIAELEESNAKARANQDKLKAKREAEEIAAKWDKLNAEIEQVRSDRAALLKNASLPLPGLSIANGELIYNNQKWDCMSGAEQLMVATSIVRRQNPDCGFVLIDGIEAMDLTSLEQYGRWLQAEGMQAITTRVSSGNECSIIIEDGMVRK